MPTDQTKMHIKEEEELRSTDTYTTLCHNCSFSRKIDIVFDDDGEVFLPGNPIIKSTTNNLLIVVEFKKLQSNNKLEIIWLKDNITKLHIHHFWKLQSWFLPQINPQNFKHAPKKTSGVAMLLLMNEESEVVKSKSLTIKGEIAIEA